MVDLSALSSQDIADQNAVAAQAPTPPSASAGFAEAFSAAREANDYYGDVGAAYNAQEQFLQGRLDQFQQATGQTLANPITVARMNGRAAGDAATDFARERFAQTPDSQHLEFPTDDEIAQGGLRISRAAVARAAQVGQDQSWGGLLGALTANTADGMTDALNVLTMGAVPEGGLLMRALGAGAGFGGASILDNLAAGPYRRAVNPDYTFGASDVASAVAQGAGLELGGALAGKAIGAAARGLFDRSPEAAASLPLPERDAATVAQRSADLDAQNPFQPGPAADAAHTEAVAAAERATLTGEPAQEPEAAAELMSAPTGAVFAPVPDTGDMPREEWDQALAQRASAIDPDTMRRAYDLDNRIDQARSQIAELQAAPPPAYALGQSRLDDAMAELAAITGKRRSSPRAKALREEILSLHAQGAQSAADVATAQADRAQTLRMSLNDLQNDRARLGPKVNAAMSQAEREARAMGFRPVDDAAAPAPEAQPSHSGNPFAPTSNSEPPLAPRAAKTKAAKTASPAPPESEAPSTPPETGVSAESIPARAPPSARGDGRAFYAGDRAVNVRYELAEARDLVTSHDDGFHANPDYPQDWQPRNRGGKPATEQVMQIASNLIPERLGPSVEANSGAPIVGPDNIVESGNGRAMAIRRAYGSDDAGAYRAFLERSGFGTTRYREPVLIARRTTPMNAAEREAFAHAANGSASLGMAPTEQAMSDARFLTPDIARLSRPGEVTSAANRDFAREFLGQFGQGERARMQAQDGGLSAVGVNRLRAAMFARAYGDPAVVARLYEHADPNIKTIGHALSAASSDWIKMRDAVTRGDIPATQDVTGNLTEAVRAIMRARDEGRPVSEVLAQGDMFVSDTTPLVARLFTRADDTSRFLAKDAMAKNVATFARDLRTGAEKGIDLFGEPPRTADQVLADMLSRARSEEAAEAMHSDANHDASLFAGLERSVEQGDNRFVREDGTVGIADADLAAIKEGENLADEIGACTVPAPAEAAE
jgi:hypothetical protein